MPGAEIVHADANAKRFHRADHGASRLDIDKRRCLGDLDDQPLGGAWCELNGVAQPVRPIRIVQRGGREVYRETRGRVLPQTCKGEVEDATIEQADEARLFRNRQQAGGSNDRPIRQHKPEQRFLERDCA